MNDIHHSRVTRRLSLTTFLTILFSLGMLVAHSADVDKASWEEGKSLFKGNCASCHNPKADGTGPALQGVTARWEAAGEFKGKTGTQWLHTWIHNWHDAVGGGYKYAVDLANSRPTDMNIFQNLNDAQITLILGYVENPDKFIPTTAKATDTADSNAKKDEGGSNSSLWLFIAFLVILVVILVAVTNQLDKIVEEKKGRAATVKVPFYKNKKFIVAAFLFGVVFLGYETVDTFVHFSRQQGYQPTQPIAFSHKLHAGQHKIDCQYCHSTANKGKNSNIPSINTCMNCHKNVAKGPLHGTEEIAKIYAAAGWNATTKTYDKPGKPVEWIRIHNLPDHVYFNHAQHVNAGKVQCQVCHGPVETMEEVYQYSPLSMGWCINCHRNTDVNVTYNKEKDELGGNGYYSTYQGLHRSLKTGELQKVTVANIGGTECQRCHY